MNQTTIFDMMYPKYKINKKIRLIELFAGYGSQALALKYLGVPYEHWRICEWAVKSIQAYKDIHFSYDDRDYSESKTKDEIIENLYSFGISSNYNEPMTKEQISRLNEKQLRTIYNNIVATNNMVNIQQVKGKDLEIVDTDKYDYIMTYSFPCQDLSLAGKGKGMSDTSTRSGMLWEVERILTECDKLGTKPQILLMENVPQVHTLDNMPDFHKWQMRLEELGYKSYWQDLIATDYEIPQTRNRCFMISILGDYSYSFPQPKPLKLKLKDMLEQNVPEKYYLSDKMINYCLGVNQKESKFPRGKRFLQSLQQTNENDIATTITTGAGQRPTDNFVLNKHLRETLEQNDKEINDGAYIDAYNRTIRDDDLSSTISTRVSAGNDTYIAIKNATKKGYLEARDGDGIDISSRMEYHRGTVQKGMTQTLTTMGGENNGVVVGTYQYAKSDNFMNGKDRLQIGKETSDTLQTSPKEAVVLGGLGEKKSNSGKQWYQQDRVYDDNIAISITTECNPYYATKENTLQKELCNKLVKENLVKEGDVIKHSFSNRIMNGQKKYAERDDGNMITLTTRSDRYSTPVKDNSGGLRIRKLTPRECFRLMGVKDEDYDKVAKNQSDASLYHLSGDSIVVNVLMAIFKELV